MEATGEEDNVDQHVQPESEEQSEASIHPEEPSASTPLAALSPAPPEPEGETASIDASVSATSTSPSQPEPPQELRARFSSSDRSSNSSDDNLGPFVVLLLDEFCRRYGLEMTAQALRRELESKQVAFPGLELWYEMHAQCHRVLRGPSHVPRSTLERLIEFCVDPIAHRVAVAQQDALAALSPVRISVSPKHSTAASRMAAYQQLRSPIVRPSQRRSSAGSDNRDAPTVEPAVVTEDKEENEHEQDSEQPAVMSSVSSTKPAPVVIVSPVRTSKKARKKGRRSSSLSTTVSLEAAHLHTQPLPLSNPLAVGTFGEPALVTAQAQDLRRDLSSQRLLDRALRHVRLEKISTEPTRALAQRLGFQSQPPPAGDAFATELVLERYGFAKRQDCALCQQSFLPLNLPCRVSFRCIMDVYDAWQYVPPDRATSTRFRAPLCYDAVQVCRFCAQLVHQHAKQQQQQQQQQCEHQAATAQPV
ncbi:hypothetical protein PINS_up004300 [Pythium insidiosum]|nr:hypothetical protein PINS_up004300 [Pythium insidiosum]